MYSEIGNQGGSEYQDAGISGGEWANDGMCTKPHLPTAANINRLMQLQSNRKFYLTSQGRIDRACEAHIARFLGCGRDTEEASRKAIWNRAKAMRLAVEKDGPDQFFADRELDDALQDCLEIITNSKTSRHVWDVQRAKNEKAMRAIARKFHVYSWARSVKGFGVFSLAKIIGETGGLNDYATKEKVWKRLGLAVINGERQQRKSGKEAAEEHGYAPRRRAEVWVVGDCLLRAQRREDKTGGESYPIGPYGVVYGRRRAHTAVLNESGAYAERAAAIAASIRKSGKTPPKENIEGRLTAAHLNNDARRIMTKSLIENLWRVWNGKQPLEALTNGGPQIDDDLDQSWPIAAE